MLVDVLTRCVRPYVASWPAHSAALWQLDWTFTIGVDVHRVQQLLVRVRAS